MVNVIISIYIIIVILLWIRTIYLSHKVSVYINKYLPEKAKELNGAVLNTYRFIKLVYEKDDIDDPMYVSLKNKSYNSLKFLFCFFIAVPLLSFLFVVIKNW